MSHRKSIKRRAAEALPSPRFALTGAAVWAALMAASADAGLYLDGWENPNDVAFVAAMFALGGAAAFPAGHFLSHLVPADGSGTKAFAAAFLSFSITTIGVTALFFAIHYRAYYAQWHGDTFGLEWSFQLAFTTAAALYQFAVLGLRLYFPVGLAALFALSLWYAAKRR